MAVEFETLIVAANTSTGVQLIRTNILPKGAMAWMGRATTDGSNVSGICCATGFTDGTNAISISTQGEDNIATSDTRRIGSFTTNILFQEIDDAGSIVAVAIIDSFIDISDTLDAAAAVNKGAIEVGLPITGHSFVAGDIITIAGTTNYDGDKAVNSVTANEVVISSSYTAETFGGTETVVAKGIRIDWTDSPPAAYLMTFVIFGGSDVEAEVGSFLSHGTENSSINIGTSFEPDLVLFLGDGQHLQETVADFRMFCFGAADKSLNQGFYFGVDKDNKASQELNGIFRTDRCVSHGSLPNGNSCEMTATSASNFTITTRDGVGSIRFGYMALDLSGASAKVLTAKTPSSVSSVYDSSFGFEPIGAIHLQTSIPNANVRYEGGKSGILGGCYCLGAFTDDYEATHCWFGEDFSTTMVEREFVTSVDVLTSLLVQNSTVKVRGAVPATAADLFQANGIEINWTTLDATHGADKYYLQIAIGNDVPADGRVMGSLAGKGGLAGAGGIAGSGGGLAA